MRRETLAQSVAMAIQVEMLKQGIRPGALAGEIGERYLWLRRRLTGQVAISIPELERIARALNVPVAKLISTGDPTITDPTARVAEPAA